MNIADVAYHTVHDYPGGSESLAPRMGMSAAVLNSKVNPNTTTHHLTLKEAVLLVHLTEDKRLVHAIAADFNSVVVDLPPSENCADGDVIALMAKSWETNGEIGKEVNKTFEDGHVETTEVARIKERAWTHFRTLFGLIASIESLVKK